MTTTETKSDYVLPPKAVAETDMNWTGKLDQKMINLSGTKKEKLLALTTGDGKTVVLSKTSVVEFSLAGMDLSLSVGKELSVRGKTSVRKTADGTVYLVSKIATATLKSSAIYDDLME